ncbi:hypothetical protein H8A97_00405 [Bradyrhizobium sp. Arg62]|uniref:hypothetical protein n=1 Tax=Bradyrhizobium brasilense TaxID=1419277 RepID=UPI001E44AD1B|nr:hypothetical protein [Bradyrhizobium brasilense]MCC8943599.1 hypothetical protein [Bradyrhizobium brasilense]
MHEDAVLTISSSVIKAQERGFHLAIAPTPVWPFRAKRIVNASAEEEASAY